MDGKTDSGGSPPQQQKHDGTMNRRPPRLLLPNHSAVHIFHTPSSWEPHSHNRTHKYDSTCSITKKPPSVFSQPNPQARTLTRTSIALSLQANESSNTLSLLLFTSGCI